MKFKKHKHIPFVLAMLIVGWFLVLMVQTNQQAPWFEKTSVHAAPGDGETDLSIQVKAWGISVSAPRTLTFSSQVASSNQVQTLQESFAGQYFTIEDLKGADTGFNTFIQLWWDLVAWQHSIPAENVKVKVTSSLAVLSGSTNPGVVVDSERSSETSLDNPLVLIKRDNAPNKGVVWTYGIDVELMVRVPAYTPIGSYNTTIVFTVTEN